MVVVVQQIFEKVMGCWALCAELGARSEPQGAKCTPPPLGCNSSSEVMMASPQVWGHFLISKERIANSSRP
jgi:hypothetical protein